MTYEKFQEMVNAMQAQDDVVSKLYKVKVDLIDFVDPYHQLIASLLTEIYGPEGCDWFAWFCYENDFGKGNCEAWDENQTPICYDLKSLWEYLETLKSNNG
jgi:hypothetical protein